MKRILFTCLMCLLCACSLPTTETKITRLSDDFNPANKTLFLLDVYSAYVPDVRLALAEYGFKVPMFASQKTVYEKKSSKVTEQYKTASTRYGLLLHSGAIIDWCLVNPGQNVRFSAEIMDVNTNDVVAIIRLGGWTEICPGAENELVFEKLAKAIDQLWRGDINK